MNKRQLFETLLRFADRCAAQGISPPRADDPAVFLTEAMKAFGVEEGDGAGLVNAVFGKPGDDPLPAVLRNLVRSAENHASCSGLKSEKLEGYIATAEDVFRLASSTSKEELDEILVAQGAKRQMDEIREAMRGADTDPDTVRAVKNLVLTNRNLIDRFDRLTGERDKAREEARQAGDRADACFREMNGARNALAERIEAHDGCRKERDEAAEEVRRLQGTAEYRLNEATALKAAIFGAADFPDWPIHVWVNKAQRARLAARPPVVNLAEGFATTGAEAAYIASSDAGAYDVQPPTVERLVEVIETSVALIGGALEGEAFKRAARAYLKEATAAVFEATEGEGGGNG